MHRSRIETRPTNQDRRAEKEKQGVSRVVVRTSNTNFTRVCLVRKKYVCPRAPSHPTLVAAREPQNPLTRNSVLRASFHLFIFFETSAKGKIAFLPSPSAALQPPLRGFGKKAIRGASHLLRAPENLARSPVQVC